MCIRPRQGTSQITSLCEAIRADPEPPTVIGYLAYTPRKRRIKVSTSISSSVEEPVSLGHLLSDSKNLSRYQRLDIAVDLAHAVLQLHKSPWLNESWSKKDIYFVYHFLDRYERPMVEYPCVSRLFKPQIQPDLNTTLITADSGNNLIINKS